MKRRISAIIPLGIRREELGEYIGSEQLAKEMIEAGWINPIVQRPKLTLFCAGDIAKAFSRLKNGEHPTQLK